MSRNTPAWGQRELADDPHAAPDKADRVRRMFSAIAPSYDLNNRLHSFWLDQRWRAAAVRLAKVQPTDRVLDVACGTGDLSRAFLDGGAADVVGLDFTPGMLELARTKRVTAKGSTEPRITYVEGDATALPYNDSEFDVVSMAFGLRNVTEPAQALRECYRVLKPGGRCIVLEFSTPRNPVIRWLNDLYTGQIMPISATLLSGDKSGAYRYLPRSIATFHDVDSLLSIFKQTGLSECESRSLTFGVCCVTRGERPRA
ncbi:MAG: bifunctional demethylmenaquinone methyltransferase/2-methoxy-6-polyprenyl-1,4-benzoquinol methylase UbiE [Planctomycetota bacterium]